ncbi:MAG: tetratricopeptide repeat protein [Bacteroidia bacterium]|nr:tetratricopeptide repeat protein [Bacteroidia bacterium]
MQKVIFIIGLLLLFSTSSAQNRNKIDSLKIQLQKKQPDTTIIGILLKLARKYNKFNPDSALLFATKAKEIAEKTKDNKRIASALNEIGWDHNVLGNYSEALRIYFLSLNISKENNDKKAIAISLASIGQIYWNKGDYPKALKYYFPALEIDKELRNKGGISINLGNIGMVYRYQGSLSRQRGDSVRAAENFSKALKNCIEALEIDKELGNKINIAAWLGNIGIVYHEQGDYPKALKYYFEALEIIKELGLKAYMAAALGNIGSVYNGQGDYIKALEYHFKALKIDKEMGNKIGIAAHLDNIGSLYIKTGQFIEAEQYLTNALTLAASIGYLIGVQDLNKNLTTLYTQTHNYPLALQHYKQYIITKDSLFNEEKSKDLGKLEAQHEFEMAEIKRKKEEEEHAKLIATAKERSDKLQYTGIFIVLVLVFLAVFALARASIPPRVVEGFLFFAFLLFFEFLLVLIDPFIEQYVGGEPVFKLLINSCLAGMIFPVHQLFERFLKRNVIRSKGMKWGKVMKLIIFGYLAFSNVTISPGNVSQIDSISKILDRTDIDTIKIKLLNKMASLSIREAPMKSKQYSEEALALSTSINYKSGIASSCGLLGTYYFNHGDYPKMFKLNLQRLEIYKETQNKKGMASCLNGIGLMYQIQGNLDEALSNYDKSLTMYRQLNNKKGMANELNNIGCIFLIQGKYKKALDYLSQSLDLQKEVETGRLHGMTLTNIADVLNNQGKSEEALSYYKKSLKIRREQNDKWYTASSLINIIRVSQNLKVRMEDGPLAYAYEGFELAKEIDGFGLRMSLAEILFEYYESKDDYKTTLKFYKEYSVAKDSLVNDSKSKEMQKLSTRYEIEKAETERKLLKKEQVRIDAEQKARHENLQYSGIGIGLILLFIGIFFLGNIALPAWVVEMSIFIPILLLFEFALVYMDPHIESMTGGEPAYKLVMNAGIAAVIFPIHQFFEGKMKKRILNVKRQKVTAKQQKVQDIE